MIAVQDMVIPLACDIVEADKVKKSCKNLTESNKSSSKCAQINEEMHHEEELHISTSTPMNKRSAMHVIEDIFHTLTEFKSFAEFDQMQKWGKVLRHELTRGAAFPVSAVQPVIPTQLEEWFCKEYSRVFCHFSTVSLDEILLGSHDMGFTLEFLPLVDELSCTTCSRCDHRGLFNLHECVNHYLLQLFRLIALTKLFAHKWGKLTSDERALLQTAIHAERHATLKPSHILECFTELDLSHCHLFVLGEEIFKCNRVRCLVANDNLELSTLDVLPPACEVARLCRCSINQVQLTQLQSSCLLVLSLAQNKLTSLCFINDLTNLRVLDVRFNYLNELHDVCNTIVHHGTLSEVWLCGNPLALIDYYRRKVISKCSNIRKLDGHEVTSSELQIHNNVNIADSMHVDNTNVIGANTSQAPGQNKSDSSGVLKKRNSIGSGSNSRTGSDKSSKTSNKTRKVVNEEKRKSKMEEEDVHEDHDKDDVKNKNVTSDKEDENVNKHSNNKDDVNVDEYGMCIFTELEWHDDELQRLLPNHHTELEEITMNRINNNNNKTTSTTLQKPTQHVMNTPRKSSLSQAANQQGQMHSVSTTATASSTLSQASVGQRSGRRKTVNVIGPNEEQLFTKGEVAVVNAWLEHHTEVECEILAIRGLKTLQTHSLSVSAEDELKPLSSIFFLALGPYMQKLPEELKQVARNAMLHATGLSLHFMEEEHEGKPNEERSNVNSASVPSLRTKTPNRNVHQMPLYYTESTLELCGTWPEKATTSSCSDDGVNDDNDSLIVQDENNSDKEELLSSEVSIELRNVIIHNDDGVAITDKKTLNSREGLSRNKVKSSATVGSSNYNINSHRVGVINTSTSGGNDPEDSFVPKKKEALCRAALKLRHNLTYALSEPIILRVIVNDIIYFPEQSVIRALTDGTWSKNSNQNLFVNNIVNLANTSNNNYNNNKNITNSRTAIHTTHATNRRMSSAFSTGKNFNNNNTNINNKNNNNNINEEGGECLSFTIGHIILDPSSLIAQDDVNNLVINKDFTKNSNESNNNTINKNSNCKLQVQSNMCETEAKETRSHASGQYRKEVVIKDAPLQMSELHLLEVELQIRHEQSKLLEKLKQYWQTQSTLRDEFVRHETVVTMNSNNNSTNNNNIAAIHSESLNVQPTSSVPVYSSSSLAAVVNQANTATPTPTSSSQLLSSLASSSLEVATLSPSRSLPLLDKQKHRQDVHKHIQSNGANSGSNSIDTAVLSSDNSSVTQPSPNEVNMTPHSIINKHGNSNNNHRSSKSKSPHLTSLPHSHSHSHSLHSHSSLSSLSSQRSGSERNPTSTIALNNNNTNSNSNNTSFDRLPSLTLTRRMSKLLPSDVVNNTIALRNTLQLCHAEIITITLHILALQERLRELRHANLHVDVRLSIGRLPSLFSEMEAMRAAAAAAAASNSKRKVTNTR